jgi:uncharacterized membrane-anchored protein YjiN (DUF445 family)
MNPEIDSRDLRLRRTKWRATSLLMLAAAVYVLAQARADAYPWLFWVGVTAEAAMVGAIADWFAVTAIFHHPFGLRFIPHTAIIPRNRERIAVGLSQFIQANFLSSAAVVQRIQDFKPARSLYAWLLRLENAEAVATYATRFAAYVLNALDDQRARRFIQDAIARRLGQADVAGAAAQVLDILTEKQRHHALLDAALGALDDLLAKPDTQAYIAAEVAKSAPLLKRLSDWFQLNLDERAALKIVELAMKKVSEVRRDRGHELRQRFDLYVSEFIARLKSDEDLRVKVQRLRDEALASPALADYVGGLWDELRAWLAADLDRSPASLHQRVTAMLETIGETLRADKAMQAWIDEQILRAAPALVEEHRARIGRFIEDQIRGWQEARLVAELERHLGPDLQYIRINGTLVGGLAGLAIAALTELSRRV